MGNKVVGNIGSEVPEYQYRIITDLLFGVEYPEDR